MRIKKGDTVQVLTGKDKGKKGKVMSILSKSQKIVVEKVNIITKHIKKTQQRAGERIQTEGPIHASNVMVLCPETKKPTKVKYEVPKSGKKYRISARSGKTLDTPFVKN